MSGEAVREVVLGRGLIDASGARHRRARLRALSGWQEVELGTASGPLDAFAASHLLAGSLERLGGYAPVTADHVAALSRGDRQRLALELRAMTFGDALLLSVACPSPVCGELADLTLSVDSLLEEVTTPEPEWIVVQTGEGLARLRAPTGADDEAEPPVADSADWRSAGLWCRLVAEVGAHRVEAPGDWVALEPATRQRIALALAEISTAPDLDVVARCPTCSTWIELTIDPFALLGRELRLGAHRLAVETHCLAFHYGWTEDAILSLPRERRWRYLELLRNQVEGRPLISIGEELG